MWKRLNNPKGARQPASTEPLPHEFNINEKHSDSAGLGFSSAQALGHRNMPPTRPPRFDDAGSRGPQRQQFEPVPPPPPQHRDSRLRPASSIYSQPSPNAIPPRFSRNAYATHSTSYQEEEVSPPSSPEFDAVNKSSQYQFNEEVSPIDEMPDVSSLGFARPPSRPGSSSRGPSSNIPVLRREKRRNQVASAAATLVSRKEVGEGPKGRQAVDPRWDPYSGEITTSDRGKPQSVKPGQFSVPGLRPVHKETGIVLGNESSITADPKSQPSFGDRVRKLKSNPPGPMEKPEWKGATGRVALVAPVADQHEIPPLSIPRKSSRRVASPHSGSTTPVSVIRHGDGETNPASSQMSEYIDPAIRTVNSNSGRNSPKVPDLPTITPDPVVVNQSAAARTLARGNTIPTEVPSTQPQKEDLPAGAFERSFHENYKDVNFGSADPYVQPPSRFSITTYAPSEATPRPSTDTFDRHPMPTPPQIYAAQQSSIVDRKRPSPNMGESPRPNVTRKAVNSAASPPSPVFVSMSTKRQSNIGKNLPSTPAEAQSHDLITSLEAQLENLAHRRNNITKSIRQMTELMPTDSVILTDQVRKKRESEKLKIELLRAEEADIRREEHDLGLRLHRAWKRRDKDAIYEPTGLWVRRVTG